MGAQPCLQSSATNPASTTGPPQHGQISDQLSIDGPRDVAVKEYSAWQETNIVDDNLKAQFRQAYEVTLANGLDLEQIHEDQDPSFFVGKGVAVGIARRFVSDIGKWLVFNNNASVPEMTYCASFSRSNNLKAPFEESCESLVRALFISPPISPDERLQLSEKLLDRIQIG
ncbi:unnamed protein product, partial [Penicillium pancosmium]